MTVLDAELGVDVNQVRFDRGLGHNQSFGNLFVCRAAGQLAQYFNLFGRQAAFLKASATLDRQRGRLDQ